LGDPGVQPRQGGLRQGDLHIIVAGQRETGARWRTDRRGRNIPAKAWGTTAEIAGRQKRHAEREGPPPEGATARQVLRELLQQSAACDRVFSGTAIGYQESRWKAASFQAVVRSLQKRPFFANFLNRLSLKRIQDDYAGLF
jgi:hypothetical protein